MNEWLKNGKVIRSKNPFKIGDKVVYIKPLMGGDSRLKDGGVYTITSINKWSCRVLNYTQGSTYSDFRKATALEIAIDNFDKEN